MGLAQRRRRRARDVVEGRRDHNRQRRVPLAVQNRDHTGGKGGYLHQHTTPRQQERGDYSLAGKVEVDAEVVPLVVRQGRLEELLHGHVPLVALDADRLLRGGAEGRLERRARLDVPEVGLEVLGLVEGEQVLVRVVERPARVGAEGQVPGLVARDRVVLLVDQQLRAPQRCLEALGAREEDRGVSIVVIAC